MNDPSKPGVDRRSMLAVLLAGGAGLPVSAAADDPDNRDCVDGPANNLGWVVAWKQTAAEYFALCHQAYNLARLRLDSYLSGRDLEDRPVAVVTDMDDTILHAASYWGHLVDNQKDFFDDAIWDEWLPGNLVTPVPGSLDFFNYCNGRGVEVFYVTSRNQGERTYEYALAQLRQLEFPYADETHLTVFRDTSDKSPARERIGESHDIALYIGDNLNDFKRDYYVTDVDERLALMNRDRAEFGLNFVLLPNPTDGHWVRAIFGTSEPEPTAANRTRLHAAATRLAWDGK